MTERWQILVVAVTYGIPFAAYAIGALWDAWVLLTQSDQPTFCSWWRTVNFRWNGLPALVGLANIVSLALGFGLRGFTVANALALWVHIFLMWWLPDPWSERWSLLNRGRNNHVR